LSCRYWVCGEGVYMSGAVENGLQVELVRLAPLAMLAVDQELAVRLVNPAAQNLLKVSFEEVKGLHLGECASWGRAFLPFVEATVFTGQKNSGSCDFSDAGGAGCGFRSRRTC